VLAAQANSAAENNNAICTKARGYEENQPAGRCTADLQSRVFLSSVPIDAEAAGEYYPGLELRRL
jgi:hypothetical protein